MTQLTPAIVQAIADGQRRGLTLESTARLIKLPPETLHSWMADASRDTRHNGRRVSDGHKQAAVALVNAIAQARAEYEAELVERIRTYQTDKGGHDWRADAFLLTHGHTRANWYEHRQTSQTITVQHAPAHTVVRELSDAELLALPDGE